MDDGADPSRESLPESSRGRRQSQPPEDVDPFTAAASCPPATDAGADPNAGAGHPPTRGSHGFTSDGRTAGPFTAGEALNPSNQSLDEQSSRRWFRGWPMAWQDPFTGEVLHAGMAEFNRRVQASASARRSQASSSTAPPSLMHPGEERTGSRTRIRQSALYADRPRRSRHRRSTRQVGHSSNVSSSELGLTNPLTFEALSVRDSSTVSPSEQAGHSSNVSSSELGLTNPLTSEALSVRDSSTVSPSEIEEHPMETGSSELVLAVTDLPTLEALSLMSELPLLTPEETSEESDDEDVDEELTALPRIETLSENDTGTPLEVPDDEYDELPGVYSCGQNFLLFNQPKGISRSMVLAADSHFITVSDDEKEHSKPDSDVDSDEFQREMEEYFAARPCINLWEAFNRTSASEHATCVAHTAEWGTEPPSVIVKAAAEAQRQPETRSIHAPQQASAAAMQRHGSSTEDVIRDEKTWMCEEVMLCFNKYLERSADLTGLDCKLDELCHQCFNVESYNKVFHHYNFRVMLKMPSSVDWVRELYFAEVKQIFGRKFYFCCPLESDEDGNCYACKKQGVEDLKHPATGGFYMGSVDAQYSLW